MQRMLSEIVPSLADGGRYRSRNHLRFTGTVVVVEEVTNALANYQALKGNLGGADPAIGLDIEWEWDALGERGDRADTSQRPTAIGFAVEGFVVIVRTSVTGILPVEFADLLSDSKIVKVGCNIAGDAARIEKHSVARAR